MTRFLKILAVVAVFFLPAWGGPGLAASTIFHSYAKPLTPPDFTIEDLKGGKFNFKEPTGDVVLLNFWATW